MICIFLLSLTKKIKMKYLFLCLLLLSSTFAFSNNVLVQNVTTTGNNATNNTIQVQFDLSWDNSWRDAINWDAAWVFMKFKNASGVWQHVQLNTTGFTNGTGTANTVQVTADKVGAWVYRSALGSGTFNSTTMQLQWNYGLSGLTSVAGLEVRVYAVEMVYVPQGDFNCAKNSIFYASGYNFPVINTRLSPSLTYISNNTLVNSLRIKGNTGIDFDNDGTIENTSYPIGYNAFYCYKYELTEQQYADFLNTLTSTQQTSLGIAGSGIAINNGQYFSSTPNLACSYATTDRILAYADWSGVRPMSFLEFNKASYGTLQPVPNGSGGYAAFGENGNTSNFSFGATNVGYAANATSTRSSAGASYYGILELTGSLTEPVVKLNYTLFTNSNGDGLLSVSGTADVSTWSNESYWSNASMLLSIDNWFQSPDFLLYSDVLAGFRYVRSAE
jgi:hypothetical protein